MDSHANFAYSTIATAPSPATSGLSLVVQTGDGSLFPTPPFNATIWPSGSNPTHSTAEIVRVTGISTDTLTITRAQEGTSARTVIVGDQIADAITVKTLTDIEGNYGGAFAVPYTFSTSTSSGDPGNGFLKWNNAAIGSVTTMYVSDVAADGSNWNGTFAIINNVTSTIKGTLRVVNRFDASQYALYTVTNQSNPGGYNILTVSASSSSLSNFANNNNLVFFFDFKGDKGDTGATGSPGTSLTKGTGTDIDTGTDDAKYITAKAINDSHNVPDVAPSTAGHLLRSDATDWQSAAVTTADIGASTNKNYVTDAQQTVIGNTSGTNTGDQTTVSGNAGTATSLQNSRTLWGQSFNGTANVTGTPTFPASASGSASMIITPGALETSPSDGDIEMDANALYACTDAGNRGVISIEHIIRQHADRGAFTSNTAQQAIFDSVAAGTLTLETGTYLFETLVQIKSMSATTGNGKFSLLGGGGATLANILWTGYGIDAAVDVLTALSGVAEIIATQTATNLGTASTATVFTFFLKGSFELTVAGSIIPSFAQTTAATAITTAGSYFKCNRIGATTMTSVGQWT